jgi:dihydropteroate synthase
MLFDRPKIMGILNITPDSFSDGGKFLGASQAIERAREMAAAGAHIIDMGAESTRPGAQPVDPETEWSRLEPVLEQWPTDLDIPVSIDTRNAVTAKRALNWGAQIINDISMGQDEGLLETVARQGAGYVLMHMRGGPATMMENCHYQDVVSEVRQELRGAYQKLLRLGIKPEQVVLDPGLGFAKTPQQSAQLLNRVGEVAFDSRPLLVGVSRKRMLRELVGPGAAPLQAASVAACLLAWVGGAHIFRVHDVEATRHAFDLTETLTKAQVGGEEEESAIR